MTSWVFELSTSDIFCTSAVNRPVPLKISVSSAKKQKISRAIKWFMSGRRSEAAHSALSFNSSTYSLLMDRFRERRQRRSCKTLRQRLFGDCAADPAIAVLEWMDAFEPEMRNRSAGDRR